MKLEKLEVITGVHVIIGLLAGWLALRSAVKSSAAKELGTKTLKPIAITSDEQPLPSNEPHISNKIQDIISAKKKETFSKAWKALSEKDRFGSVAFASVCSVGVCALSILAMRIVGRKEYVKLGNFILGMETCAAVV